MPGPLYLSPGMKTTCVVLEVVPLPGVGAIVAGSRNPHSGYIGRGVAQAVLVVFGSWPLIVPGAVGLVWAIWDAVRIGQAAPLPPWTEPTPDAEPDTLRPTRQQKAEARRRERERKRAGRAARKAARAKEGQAEDDETRWMP